jgi:ATP-binding cassette subfamily C protein
MEVWHATRKFWSVISPTRRRHVVLLVGFMIIASFLEMLGLSTIPVFLGLLASPGDGMASDLIEQVKAWADVGSKRAFFVLAATALGAAFLLQTVALSSLAFFKARFVAAVIRDLADDLFTGYLRAPLSFHAERHSSLATTQIVLESMRTANGFTYPLLHMIQSALLITAIVTFVVVMSPPAAIFVMLGIGVGAVAFMVVMRRRAQGYGHTLTRQNAKLTEDVGEALGCLKHIRLRGLEPRFETAFARDSEARARAIGFQRFANEFPKPILEGATVLGMIVIVFALLGSNVALTGMIPALGLIGAAVARVLPHINQFTTWILRLYQNASSATSLADDILSLRAMGVYQAAAPADPGVDARFLTDSIVFQDVTFRYPAAAEDAVTGANLTIGRNEAVAFVGPTGAGKSTMVDLICGLVTPTDGNIRVDGYDLSTVQTAWQRHIGYIPQSIFLANRTLRENVALGLPPSEIDDARVRHVLAQAQLDDLVETMPDGLHTHVGENGLRLSGGQRQRVGIARALYHDPKILILDEATAALDNDTERRLMAAIEQVRANRTLIMVAHRLSSIRNCDRIFMMENGHVTGEGTYDELLDSHPGFRAMAA